MVKYIRMGVTLSAVKELGNIRENNAQTYYIARPNPVRRRSSLLRFGGRTEVQLERLKVQ